MRLLLLIPVSLRVSDVTLAAVVAMTVSFVAGAVAVAVAGVADVVDGVLSKKVYTKNVCVFFLGLNLKP